MHAVILAAGRGSRLGSRTDNIPKALVELGGRSLLDWQHAALREAGVQDITVVTGYLGEVIEQRGFRTISNRDWSRGNMVSSLACALEHIPGPLLVSYSDIVYGSGCVTKILGSEAPLAITYDREWLNLWRRRFEDPLSDAETFRVNEAGEVVEIGRRAASVDVIAGQFMGLLTIGLESRQWIEELLNRYPDFRLTLDTTSLIDRLIADERSVKGVPISGGWCEIDSLSDLHLAEQLVADGELIFPGS